MLTLRNEIKMSGIGLHSGERSVLHLRPCGRAGIFFRGKNGLSPTADAVVEEDSRLTGFSLPNGVTVRTGEHLLAAVAGMGLEAVEIELDGPEVPIMDGSAYCFAEAIKECGFEETAGDAVRTAVSCPIAVSEKNGERLAVALPAENLSVTYVIDYPGTPIGTQSVKYDITPDVFYNIISKARTFGLTYELGFLKENGLAKGGSLENALIFDDRGPVGGQKLRFPLECVTHKVIDLLGDLTLAGPVPVGHYIAVAAGHSTHGKLVRRLKAQYGYKNN